LVNDSVILELKVAKRLHSRHRAQLINVLKASSLEVGLLLNFGPKATFKRAVYANARKVQRNASCDGANPGESAIFRANPR
jgi:hypothetical protein